MLNQVQNEIDYEEHNITIVSNLAKSYLKNNLYKDNDKLALRDFIVDLEKEIISKALKVCNGNQKNTASLLSINYTTLNEKLKKMDIHIKKQIIFENRLF